MRQSFTKRGARTSAQRHYHIQPKQTDLPKYFRSEKSSLAISHIAQPTFQPSSERSKHISLYPNKTHKLKKYRAKLDLKDLMPLNWND